MRNKSLLGRRMFSRLALGSVVSWGVGQAGRGKPNRLIIDCHAHIYSEDEERYPTIEKPKRPPAGTGTLAHLGKEMRENSVRFVTAIQTSSFYRWDNRFTADSARAKSDMMAAVVTLDPDDPESPDMLTRYVRDYNARGMRSVPAKSGHLDDPGVLRLWRRAEELGIVINVLTDRRHRAEIESMVGRQPQLRVVIDHCLNLAAGPSLNATLKDVCSLASFPNVYAKLTFIPTGSAEAYPCRDMHRACHTVIDAFSPSRCVWGSNFPCELWCPHVSYSEHLAIFTEELGLEDDALDAILGGTASRLWFQD